MNKNNYPQEFVSFKRKENVGFSHYYKVSFAAVHTYLKARFKLSDADCEDVIQEAFVKLYLVIDGIREPTQIIPFLIVTARNTYIDQIRRDERKKNREKVIREVLGEDINLQDYDLVKAEVLATVRVYLHLLSEKNRTAFTMHFFEGFSYEEIAVHMDIEEKTVDYHIKTAINILRPHLKEILLCVMLVGGWGSWEA